MKKKVIEINDDMKTALKVLSSGKNIKMSNSVAKDIIVLSVLEQWKAINI